MEEAGNALTRFNTALELGEAVVKLLLQKGARPLPISLYNPSDYFPSSLQMGSMHSSILAREATRAVRAAGGGAMTSRSEVSAVAVYAELPELLGSDSGGLQPQGAAPDRWLPAWRACCLVGCLPACLGG